MFAKDGNVGDGRARDGIEHCDSIFSGGRDKGASVGKHDIAGLVGSVDRVNDKAARERDDADAVGDLVDDPDFVVRARGHGHGLDADGYFGGQHGVAWVRNIEDGQAIIGCVNREKTFAIGGKANGADLFALEIDEIALPKGSGCTEEKTEAQTGHTEVHSGRLYEIAGWNVDVYCEKWTN